MRIETLKSCLIAILLCAALVLAVVPQLRFEAKAVPSPYTVAQYYGLQESTCDLNFDGKVDFHDIALAAAQYTTTDENDPMDPLEAWSESELIIWQYNATHYGCKNMSTLLVQDKGTNLTLVEQYALGNMTSGLLYLKDVPHNTSLTMEDDEVVIQCYDGTYQLFSNLGKGFLPAQLATDPVTTDLERGFWWYNYGEDCYKYWNGSAIVTFPGIGGGSAPGGTYTLDWMYLVHKVSSTYYAERYDGSILTSGSVASTVINAAVAALSSGRTWKETVVIKGNITLSAHIDAVNYTCLDCRQAYFILTANTEDDLVAYHSSSATTLTDFEVLGGVWDGNQANQGATQRSMGVDIWPVGATVTRNLVFRDMEIKNIRQAASSNAEGHGIGILATTYNLLIDNCYIHDGSNFTCTENGNAIFLNGVTYNSTISNCHITSYCSGIYLYGYAYYCHVVDNFINYVNRDGISLYTYGASGGVDWNTVSGNTIVDWAADQMHDAIKVGHHGNVYGAHGNIISNNIIRSTYNKTYAEGVNLYENATDNTVEGNLFEGFLEYPVRCNGSRNFIDGNKILNQHTIDANVAILLEAGADLNVVINNYCYDIGTGATTEISNLGGATNEVHNNYQDEDGWVT